MTVSIKLKIAVFAPIPSASESIATPVMTGVRPRMRKPVANILQERFDQIHATRVANLFLELFVSAKIEARAPNGFFARQDRI